MLGNAVVPLARRQEDARPFVLAAEDARVVVVGMGMFAERDFCAGHGPSVARAGDRADVGRFRVRSPWPCAGSGLCPTHARSSDNTSVSGCGVMGAGTAVP